MTGKPNPLTGMAEDPGKSYGIASRLTCAKCGCAPTIIKASGGVGGELVALEVTCHGSKESRSIAKDQLVFQQYFFESEAT